MSYIVQMGFDSTPNKGRNMVRNASTIYDNCALKKQILKVVEVHNFQP